MEVNANASQEEDDHGQGQASPTDARATAQAGRGRRTQDRLAALISPWWERNPAELEAEIRPVEQVGFRVRQDTDASHRLLLHLERGPERYRLLYDDDRRVSAYILGPGPSDRRTRFITAIGRRAALALVDELARGGGQHLGRGIHENVLVPETWNEIGTGDHGLLTLGRARIGGALVPLAITGTSESARLLQAAAPFARAFPYRHDGLWVRGRWIDEQTSDPELLLASVESQLAEAHGLLIEGVRERLKREIGALAQPLGLNRVNWNFVRRAEGGEAVVLQSRARDAVSLERAPYALQLKDQRVAVVGCGAVGWTVAMLLARSGVRHFSLYDDDYIYSANLARLGAFLGDEGQLKAHALAAELEAVGPGVTAEAHAVELGTHAGALALVDAKPDLIINLTGEEISTAETNLAALFLRKPALYAWVSNSVLGGRIFRVRPFEGPCYECVRQAAPAPIRSDGHVPIGEVPWRGSVVDVDLFAAAVAKAAVLTLCRISDPHINPEHLVLRFDGLVPITEPISIARDRRCSVCGSGR